MGFFGRLKGFASRVSNGIKKAANTVAGWFSSKAQRNIKRQLSGQPASTRAQSDSTGLASHANLTSAKHNASAPAGLRAAATSINSIGSTLAWSPQRVGSLSEQFFEGEGVASVAPLVAPVARARAGSGDSAVSAVFNPADRTLTPRSANRAATLCRVKPPKLPKTPSQLNQTGSGMAYAIHNGGVHRVTVRGSGRRLHRIFSKFCDLDQLGSSDLPESYKGVLQPIANQFSCGDYLPHMVYIYGEQQGEIHTRRFSAKRLVTISDGAKLSPSQWRNADELQAVMDNRASLRRAGLCGGPIRKRTVAIHNELQEGLRSRAPSANAA
jgi:hypothetical protein